MLLWSGVGGQLLSHHVAVVRGWWSAIVTSCCCGQGLVVSHSRIMLLWSGVGGQLLSHHVAVVGSGPLLSHHVAVVRGWWSATFSHVAVVKGWWSAIVSSCCCGQGLVVSYCHIMLLWSGVGGQLLSRSLEGPFRGACGKNTVKTNKFKDYTFHGNKSQKNTH